MTKHEFTSMAVQINSQSPKEPQVPSFSIFKPNSGETVETLKHCFLDNQILARHSLPAQICAKDGLVYTAVYDSRIPEGLESIPVVISFQQHSYGRFAVIRVDKKQLRRD